MMASVFIMQPIGQLMASLVGLAVLMTLGRQAGLKTMTDAKEAATVVDRIWRWVVGAGAIPAIIAIGFRLTIPESPRYTLDVDHDGVRALRDTTRYCTTTATQLPTSQPMDERRVPHMEYSAVDGMQPLPRAHYEETNDNDSDSMEIMDVGGPTQERTQNMTPGNYNDDDNSEDEENNPDPFSYQELKQFFWTEGNIKPLLGTSITWFLLDFAFYGLGINNPRTIADIWSSEPHVAKSSDTPAWGNPADHGLGIYETLKQDGIRSIITVSVGSLLGSIILIKAINYIPRKAWLLWSFVGMGVLFAVIGGSFFKVAHTDLHALTITLYVLCQLLFNLGMFPIPSLFHTH
jgi:PHS family inorganic phosphate transporter-like MFS transporter